MSSGPRRWARLVIVGNAVFVVAWVVAAAWQGPHYSVTAHSISDMYANHAPAAWFLIVVLTLSGAAVMLFTFLSLWPALRAGGWPARVGVLLMGLSVFGLGDLLTVFEQENCRLADAGCAADLQFTNFGGAADATLTTAGSYALILSGFFLAAAMRRLPEWRSWSRPTIGASVLIIVLILVDGLAGNSDYAGLVERVFAFAGAAWISVLALAVLRTRKVLAETAA